jgi:hypothetical protein
MIDLNARTASCVKRRRRRLGQLHADSRLAGWFQSRPQDRLEQTRLLAAIGLSTVPLYPSASIRNLHKRYCKHPVVPCSVTHEPESQAHHLRLKRAVYLSKRDEDRLLAALHSKLSTTLSNKPTPGHEKRHHRQW